MCTQARMPSVSRRNESASSKSFAVSGSIVIVEQPAQVDAVVEDRLRQLERLELAERTPLAEQRFEHVLDPLARCRSHARAAPVRGPPHEGEFAGLVTSESLELERRSADPE